MEEIRWSQEAEETFTAVLSNLPQFHRAIAQRLVKESATQAARDKGKDTVETKELIEAFFKEVPPAFKDMMRRLFSQLGIEREDEA